MWRKNSKLHTLNHTNNINKINDNIRQKLEKLFQKFNQKWINGNWIKEVIYDKNLLCNKPNCIGAMQIGNENSVKSWKMYEKKRRTKGRKNVYIYIFST